MNYPVVYCTEAFARLFGYDRAEIMLKSACCTFLFGELTDDKAASKINSIFENQTKDSVELLLYKRNSEFHHFPAPRVYCVWGRKIIICVAFFSKFYQISSLLLHLVNGNLDILLIAAQLVVRLGSNPC